MVPINWYILLIYIHYHIVLREHGQVPWPGFYLDQMPVSGFQCQSWQWVLTPHTLAHFNNQARGYNKFMNLMLILCSNVIVCMLTYNDYHIIIYLQHVQQSPIAELEYLYL